VGCLYWQTYCIWACDFEEEAAKGAEVKMSTLSTHTSKTPGGQMNRDRYAELKRILEERRREILSEVHEKIRDVRTEGANSPTHGVLDA
jgi:hypothetical protein